MARMGWGGKAGLALTALIVIGWLLDALANVLGLAESSTLVSFTEWLYPVGFLVAAGVVILALLAAVVLMAQRASSSPSILAEPDTQADERRRERDRETLRRIREILPRNQANFFLRDHDFGGSWRISSMRQVSELARHNDVEDRFLDGELEALRVELHEALAELDMLFATDSFRSDLDSEWQDVGVRPHGPEHPETELWLRRQRLLNEAASRAFEAYDALLDRAREKTLL
jgi:hypothetical protein